MHTESVNSTAKGNRRVRWILKWLAIIFMVDFLVCLTTICVIDDSGSMAGRPVWWLLRVEARGVNPDCNEAYHVISSKGGSAVPSLIAALSKGNSRFEELYRGFHAHLPPGLAKPLPPPVSPFAVRAAAASHLAGLGLHAEPALPALLLCTRATNAIEQCAAIQAIRGMGAKAASAVPRLRELLKDPDERVRVNAAAAISDVESTSPALVAVLMAGLKSSNMWTHMDALRGMTNNESTLIPNLEEQLKDTNGWNARLAMGILYTSSDRVKLACKEGLWVATEHPNTSTAAQAVNLLINLPLTSADNETLLSTLIRRGLPSSRGGATYDDWSWFYAIAKLGPAAHSAIPILLAKIATPADRNYAMSTLQTVGGPTEAELPAVLSALNSTNRLVRICAIECLIQAKINTHAAIPGILETLKDPEQKVRVQSPIALYQACREPEIVAPPMMVLLRDPDPVVRRQAVTVLGWFGPKNGLAVPGLLAALDDPDKSVRDFAVYAFREMGTNAVGVVPVLTMMLQDTNTERRVTAAYALCGAGSAASNALPQLTVMLEHRNPEVRLAAAWAIWRIDRQKTAPRAVAVGIVKSAPDGRLESSARDLLKLIDAPNALPASLTE